MGRKYFKHGQKSQENHYINLASASKGKRAKGPNNRQAEIGLCEKLLRNEWGTSWLLLKNRTYKVANNEELVNKGSVRLICVYRVWHEKSNQPMRENSSVQTPFSLHCSFCSQTKSRLTAGDLRGWRTLLVSTTSSNRDTHKDGHTLTPFPVNIINRRIKSLLVPKQTLLIPQSSRLSSFCNLLSSDRYLQLNTFGLLYFYQ